MSPKFCTFWSPAGKSLLTIWRALGTYFLAEDSWKRDLSTSMCLGIGKLGIFFGSGGFLVFRTFLI